MDNAATDEVKFETVKLHAMLKAITKEEIGNFLEESNKISI